MPYWRTNYVQPGHLYSPYYPPATHLSPGYHPASFYATPAPKKQVRFTPDAPSSWRERYAAARRRAAIARYEEQIERERESASAAREMRRRERLEEERRSWANYVSRMEHEREEELRRKDAAARGQRVREFEWRAVPEPGMVFAQPAPVPVPVPVPVQMASPYVSPMHFIPQGTPYFSPAPAPAPVPAPVPSPSGVIYLPTPKVPNKELENLKGHLEDRMWEYRDKFKKVKKELEELSPSKFFPELSEIGDGHVLCM